MSAAIVRPEMLHIQGPGAIVTRGASQSWYLSPRKRLSGCGPTVASMQLWYLSRTRPGWKGLCPYHGETREGFLPLMKEMFRFVTPGMRGVNTTGLYTDGVRRYGEQHGFDLQPRVLDISIKPEERPDPDALYDFLTDSFRRDVPVAFLNLSNGSLRNLESWHWVLLVGVGENLSCTTMYDQGSASEIDLALWLDTATLGGGLVSLE